MGKVKVRVNEIEKILRAAIGTLMAGKANFVKQDGCLEINNNNIYEISKCKMCKSS